jgi:hypothetical protein
MGEEREGEDKCGAIPFDHLIPKALSLRALNK